MYETYPALTIGAMCFTYGIFSMVCMSRQLKLSPTNPLPCLISYGITMMFVGPKVSSCVLTSTVSPWVMLMSPVTAAQPMSMPRTFRASLNLRSPMLWNAVSIVSSSFNSPCLDVVSDINEANRCLQVGILGKKIDDGN